MPAHLHRHRRRRLRRQAPRLLEYQAPRSGRCGCESAQDGPWSWDVPGGDISDILGCWVPWGAMLRRCLACRSARMPLSSGVQAIGRRLVATQPVVDMKSRWHIRSMARVRPPKRFNGAEDRAPRMATSAACGGIGWRLGYGLRSIRVSWSGRSFRVPTRA